MAENTTRTTVALDDLVANERNPRADLRDLGGLTASIRGRGVVQALTVSPLPDGKFRIVAGHRRAAAARAAGLSEVPCMVVPDGRAESDDVLDMLVENVHRDDLTTAEQVDGVRQLVVDFGMSAKAVGEQTGVGLKQARRLARVARDETSTHALHSGLDLEQALTLAEWAGDEDAQARLLGAAEQGRFYFEREVSSLRTDRAITKAVQSLAEAGVTAHSATGWAEARTPTAQMVSRLRGGEGSALDPEAHAECAGHVVVVDTTWGDDLSHTAWCADPEAHGHALPEYLKREQQVAAEADSDEAREQARVERRRVVRCNREWRAARDTRQGHVAAILKGRSAPKGALDLVARLIACGAANEHPTTLATLLGVQTNGAWRPQARMLTDWLGETPTDARRTLALLAVAAAHVESAALTDTAWRNPTKDGLAARYLDWLATTGYDPGPVERLAIGTMTAKQVDRAHARADATASTQPQQPGQPGQEEESA